MEGPRLTLLIILLLFIFFSPDQPRIPRYGQNEDERLAVEKAQDLDALANSSYGDLTHWGLNLTGLRLEDGYQINLLPIAQDLSRKQHEQDWDGLDAFAPVYHDIDGQVNGGFVRIDVQSEEARKINLTELDPTAEYLTNVYERNVTEPKGKLAITLEDLERKSKYIPREVKALVSIFTDSSPGNGWEVNMRGIHFPSGSIVFTTSSRKFNGLPALPHFTLSEEEFNRSTPIMNASLTEIWKHMESVDESTMMVAPRCELVAWLHQKPLLGNNLYIQEIENELNDPDGAPISNPPPMAYSAILFSPDCGFILQADTLYGPKREVYSDLVRRLISAFCMIMVLQIVLLKRQMEKCATPSTRSRISYKTIGIAAFSDGLTLFAVIGLLIADFSVFLLAGVAAFLCCIHVAFLEVKFIFDIWTVQVGDPANAERERQRRTAGVPGNTTSPAAAPSTTAANAPASDATVAPPAIVSTPAPPTSEAGLPLPVTARANPAQPVVFTSDQDTTITPRASFASLYTKFYFALINLTFFTLWASSWPNPYRHIYFNLLIFSFFSLWLPQIYRNTMRNCRKALNWEYVLGTSILRAVPVLYWYIDDRNILNISTNPRTAMILLFWLVLQTMFLLSQQFFGARWFVRNSWCPPAYDYHPVLYDDLETGGLPIGEVTSASEGKDAETSTKDKPLGTVGTRKIFDCAICMNEIDVPVVSKDEKGSAWLEQRKYMVTPCRHIFHSECLEGWMNLRLVCPVCREGLPPL
ncbi:hypothetical protein H2198_003692 [Neophaeococcomyces mojaviensis]|uniref:Uncharacterized protein n=1 Tax=Neophaeococcomyces mojaviensis TaxID=3383035 RepID=A0ACC3AAM3_9EURO|nr:hypothetical protein H2198_003692 [Knufia sp. JES_112]